MNLANSILTLYGVYLAVIGTAFALILLRSLPDAFDRAFEASARFVRPGASAADIDRWSDMVWAYLLALPGMAALFLLGKALAFLLL